MGPRFSNLSFHIKSRFGRRAPEIQVDLAADSWAVNQLNGLVNKRRFW
jgi:hypothetical protein